MTTTEQIAALTEASRTVLDDLDDLIGNSEGVAGLHHNGNVADWPSLLDGGSFWAWLRSIEQLRAVLASVQDATKAMAAVREAQANLAAMQAPACQCGGKGCYGCDPVGHCHICGDFRGMEHDCFAMQAQAEVEPVAGDDDLIRRADALNVVLGYATGESAQKGVIATYAIPAVQAPADDTEALRAEVERLRARVAQLEADLASETERAEVQAQLVSCACAYERLDDICMGHKRIVDHHVKASVAQLEGQALKDRKSANAAMSDALMWQFSVADGLHDGQPLLVTVWRQRKEAERRAAAAEARVAQLEAQPITAQDGARVPEIAALIDAADRLVSAYHLLADAPAIGRRMAAVEKALRAIAKGTA